jgi:diguanylate cyclase (GGDEF)-like protein/PAS domain S-box-containing protein
MDAEAVIDIRAPLGEYAAAVSAAGPDYRDVFLQSPVAMAVLDHAGRIVELNPAAGRLLGSEPGELRGRPLHELAAPDDAGRLRLGTTERRLRHARGHDLWVVASAVELPGGVRQTLVCLDDATARRNTERLLLHAALHDSLTNLPNRRLLRDRLDTALARAERTERTVAVLFLDLDGFKDVNDTYGHDAGDEVLVGVAAAIHGALRSCDTVARLGGDEFVVVCEDVDEDHDVTRLAQRLVDEIERPITVQGHALRVRTSIGIAVAGSPAGSGDELLRAADLAMLRAKQLPGTAYVFFDEDADRPATSGERLGGDLLAELRHAIQADLLALYYQPVVHVQGGLLGLEALVRWPHPDLGLLLPEDFLPRVIGSELARPLTDWVLRAAVRDAASWRNPRVRVSVNVWAGEAARPGFSDTVALLLDWAGLAPRGLYLEIREQDLPDGGPGLPDELDRLRRLGVGLAVDDFGSGGTSLAGLRHLPVDTLKVDRSFVAGMLRDRDDEALLAAVATAARAAGQHALATGVETVEQLAAVRALGYESVQGYLAGPPQPLVDLRDTIRRRVVDLDGR